MTDTTASGKWILIVEDDEYINKAYAAKFEHEQVPAKFAVEGDEALKILRETPELPSLILLDLMLPKKNGFEILQELKADERLKQIPVVILTNLAQENDAKKGLELGAIKYLIKADTKIADILAVVREHI
jgi:DNA-binding response OmpR family regulator